MFPEEWKLPRVTPIHKGEAKYDVSHYRPISILGTVCKVFERIVYGHLCKYLNENNLLHGNQSGFRPYNSTANALLDATTEWLSNTELLIQLQLMS